jgi:hypothetical protein
LWNSGITLIPIAAAVPTCQPARLRLLVEI